jgi:YHS domain-containing protein
MKTVETISNEFLVRGSGDRAEPRMEPERRSSLSGLLSLIFRPHEHGDSPERKNAEPARSALEGIERELQAITDRAEAALRDSVSRVVSGADSSSSARPRTPDPRELLRGERDVARGAMEEDIVRLHRQLGTAITPERMESLARVLAAHGAPSGNAPGVRFQDRIEMGVLRYLYLRAGEAAWSRLEGLLARTGLAWPPPDGLSANNPTEELQRQREAHTEEVRKHFLSTPPTAIAALIHGTVEAWRYGYPGRNSYLWLQTALCAVAAALRAEAFAVAVELWLWRSPDLEREILECVSEKLGDARSILERGVHTVIDAAEVVARVDEVCGTAIPQIVWNHAAKRLLKGSWRSWPEQASANPEEAIRTDPVCGMTLPAQGAVERLESDGKVFCFCNASCRRKFEERLGGTAPSQASEPSGNGRRD